MTIPWLMNCGHSDDSWCLECVRKMGEENERMRISHRRYETVRRMTAQQFAAACKINIRTGKPFDEIIDDWILHALWSCKSA